MKHLDSQLLAAAADGQPLAPAQRAHLADCPQCSAEAAELRALMAELAEVPAPPKDLHQRTLQRIGLAPRAQSGWSLRWGWLGAAAMGAVALYISMPSPSPKCLPLVAKACPPKAGQTAGHSLGPDQTMSAKPAPAADTAAEAAAATSDAPETLASAPASEDPAQGQAPAAAAQDQVQLQQGPPSAKATPTAVAEGLRLLAVRGNLLKPSLGERLQVELSLGHSGLLDAHVLDSRGRVAAVLQRGSAGPGPVQLSWDGQDAPSGAYTLKLAFEGQKETVKILLVR